jgi:hypothetical protein
MQVFGDYFAANAPRAPEFAFATLAEPPKGEDCTHCHEAIQDGDDGIILEAGPMGGSPRGVYHLACWLRPMIGSAAHIEQRCCCYVAGSSDNDDPKLTKRQAAQAALEAWGQRLVHLYRHQRSRQ